MDSELVKSKRSRKGKKARKEHLNQTKMILNKKRSGDAEQMCNHKEREIKQNSTARQKMSKKRKKLAVVSISSTDLDYSYIELCNNANKESSNDSNEKDVSHSSKVKNKLKKKKKALIKNKDDNIKVSKNVDGKRKRVSIKDVKFFKCKNREASSSRNKVGNCDKKNFISTQKSETESSDESDQEIRNEIKCSSIYNNIQKLLKDDPSLLPTGDFCEEECSESATNLNDSEEESIECWSDTSNNDIDEESEMLQTDSVSNKNNKVKNVSERDYKESQSDSPFSISNEKFITESINSEGGFIRTKKNDLAQRDKKVNPKKMKSSLREKSLEKLQGAKFRYLNEKLYTESGTDSFDYFQRNTDEYVEYHKGYRLQVAKWPLNPVDKIIDSLQKMKKNMIIADMGCGEAKIAHTLSNCTVHSFDLVALNAFVTPCNISKVPLSNESVDVVVFCLSLMGTNLKEYLQEAYRIAKFGAKLKIVEVESRIPNLDQFIKSTETLGFSIEKKDVEHKLFVFLEFIKTKKKKKSAKLQDISLRPCLYKKR